MALPPIKFPSLKNSEDTPKAVLKTNVQGFSSIESNLSDIKGILQKQFEFNVDWQRKQNLADIERRNEEKSKGDKIASGKGTGAVVATGDGTTGGGGGGSTVGGAAAGFGLAGLAAGIGTSIKKTFTGLFGPKPGDVITSKAGNKVIAGMDGKGTTVKPGDEKGIAKIKDAAKKAGIGNNRGLLKLVRGGGLLSVLGMGMDAYAGVETADKDGQSKMASGIGNAIGGGKGGGVNAAMQAMSGAALGASIGSFIIPGIGTAIGAGIGGVVGGAAGAIGGETITNAVDDITSEVAGIFGKTLEISPGRKQSIEKRIEESGKHQETALKEIESLTKTIEDTANVSLEDRKAALEKRKGLEDALRESQENVARDKDILVRNEMAILEKEKDALESKKEITAKDEKRIAELEAQRQKLKESPDYQKDIGDKVADIGDKVADIGSSIGSSFSSAMAGMGDFFSTDKSDSGQMKRGRGRGAGTGEITGFGPESLAAMNALPMKGNEITGFSMMQSNRLRNRRPANDSGTGEITGFTRAQAAASAAAMNALPMDADGKILGFSTNQGNMLRRRNMERRSAGRVPTQSSNITSKQDLTPEKIAAAKATLDAAAAEARERFTGPVLQHDGSMRGAKSLSYNKGTLGEDNDLMQNFGKGTPAVLHGNEAVLNEEQLANLARGIPLAAETLLKKVRSPSAEGVKANETISNIMGSDDTPGVDDLSKDVIKKIDDVEPSESGRRELRNDDGTTYFKDSKGRYIFLGGFGKYMYSPQGKLLSYETPSMAGLRLKKDIKTGNVTQTFKDTMEDGTKVSRSKTFDESGVGLSGSFQATQGGVTVGGDTSGNMFTRFTNEIGQRIEKKTQLTGAALEAAQKEMMTPMTPTNVVAPTDNSTVNNVVNNNSTVAPKPQARNQEPSSARYGGMMAGAY
jgi:hypothetical protein